MDTTSSLLQIFANFLDDPALIYMHRTTFASAINECPNDPTMSAFQPSFTAGYHSACDLLMSLHAQFHAFPEHIARMWNLWTHAFSSAVRRLPSLMSLYLTLFVAGHAQRDSDARLRRRSEIEILWHGSNTGQERM